MGFVQIENLQRLLWTARRVKRAVRSAWWAVRFRPQLAVAHRDLQTALAGSSGPVMLFMPGLSWNRQLVQRPQHLARALAAQGARVFYLEPDPRHGSPPLVLAAPNLYVCNAPVALFSEIPAPWVYQLTWSLDPDAPLNHPRLIYDLVDDLGVFAGSPLENRHNHAVRLARAELILASSLRLQAQAPGALLCPNAVDLAHFQPSLPPSRPPQLRDLRQAGRPVIGYVGAVARWMDFDLLNQVTRLRPGYEFVLVGPRVDGALAASGLLRRPNLHWVPQQPYEAVPAWLAGMDAAMIPFKLDAITHATSPLKLFEFFAAGKPVVITPMEESLRYPAALPAARPEEFAARLDEALALKDDPTYLEQIRATARANTWAARAAQILKKMSALDALRG